MNIYVVCFPVANSNLSMHNLSSCPALHTSCNAEACSYILWLTVAVWSSVAWQRWTSLEASPPVFFPKYLCVNGNIIELVSCCIQVFGACRRAGWMGEYGTLGDCESHDQGRYDSQCAASLQWLPSSYVVWISSNMSTQSLNQPCPSL